MFIVCMCRARGRGCLRLSIDIEDIEFLRGLRFSYSKIAAILRVSRATLYRKLMEEGVNPSYLYAEISDTDLDQEIVDIKCHQPNDGERLVIGIIVPRAWVRGSIHRVDLENTAVRRSVTIRRRVYYVDGPNSLWHVDGHHKLIRWRMVTHWGIDGYSRTVVFLSCSDNNRASTMFSTFVTGLGLPERILTNLGGEIVDIWCYAAEQHGSTSAVITGSSTYNQRIERLWRGCVGVVYHDCFRRGRMPGSTKRSRHVPFALCFHATCQSYVTKFCWFMEQPFSPLNITLHQISYSLEERYSNGWFHSVHHPAVVDIMLEFQFPVHINVSRYK